jgi:hypothetical protein
LTLLSQGTMPDFLLLEDARDIVTFLLTIGHAVPAAMWAEKAIAAARENVMEGFF